MKHYYKLFKHSWSHCSTFSGRASSEEYWVFTLSYFVLFIVFVMTCVLAMLYAKDTPVINNSCRIIAIPLCAHFLVGILPLTSVTVRRLHDANFDGILALLMLAPGGLLVLMVLCSLMGKKEANQWGQPVVYPWQATPGLIDKS